MGVGRLIASIIALSATAGLTWADTIVLKDGTVLGGVVKQVPNGYEIVNTEGKSTFVPKADVKSIKLSNDGKVTEQSAKERLASLRRSVEAESQIDRVLERYKQFIEMNKDTDASADAQKDIEQWEGRKAQGMVKVGTKWMTPAQRDDYLVATAKTSNEIADQIAAGDIAGATRRIAQGLEEDPNNISLAYLDGVLQLRRNRYNEAKRAFDIVIEQIPDHPPTLYNEAAIASHFKRWPVAISTLEKVMTLEPNRPEILNGVAEFLRLLPETNKRSAAFDRFMLLYTAQERTLGAEMAKKGLYRFGSSWATQDKIDELNKKLAEFEVKKKAMQTDIDASQDRIRDLARQIDTINRQLEEVERERIVTDSVTGRIAYRPRPAYYYDLVADRDRLTREAQAEKVKTDELKAQAKELETQAPHPPFADRVVPVGEAGVPIIVPANAVAQPTTAPATIPTTQSSRPPLPLLPFPPYDTTTTQPQP
jgi:tetratricopeptide (TPR) repeat protein